MHLLPTRLNRELASVVQNRATAESAKILGQVGFWRFVGLGLLGFGLGLAACCAFIGYSYITRNSTGADAFADAFTKALKGIELRGTAVGSVDLKHGEVTLAKDQTISIDPSSRLLLDRDAKIFVEADVKVQTPMSAPQINVPRSAAAVPTISNFTVFKSVQYEKGGVHTGWLFLTSTQPTPSKQYCYYNESLEEADISVRIELGSDGISEKPKNAPKAFDASEAFKRCVWFSRGN